MKASIGQADSAFLDPGSTPNLPCLTNSPPVLIKQTFVRVAMTDNRAEDTLRQLVLCKLSCRRPSRTDRARLFDGLDVLGAWSLQSNRKALFLLRGRGERFSMFLCGLLQGFWGFGLGLSCQAAQSLRALGT